MFGRLNLKIIKFFGEYGEECRKFEKKVNYYNICDNYCIRNSVFVSATLSDAKNKCKCTSP